MEKKSILQFVVGFLVVGGITAGVAAGFFVYRNANGTEYSVTTVERRDLIRDVAVTGSVVPVEEVDLAFEQAGVVTSLVPTVGTSIRQGQVLLEQDTRVLDAQIQQRRSELLAEQLRLEELLTGIRPEEVEVIAAKLSAADENRLEAEEKLISVQMAAVQDLQADYSAAAAALRGLVVTAKSALITLSNIQEDYFLTNTITNSELAKLKSDAMVSLFALPSQGTASTQFVSQQTGGLYGRVSKVADSDQETVDSLITTSFSMAEDIAELLDAVPLDSRVTATEKTNLATARAAVASDVSTVRSTQQALAVQKATNNSNIISAQQAFTQAKNNHATVLEEYQLAVAGPTPQQIRTQEAVVASVEDSVGVLEAQKEQYTLRSPIDGIVTDTMIERGELASALTPVIRLISEAEFEIETFIPEIDIAYIEVGMTAEVTLEAYGESEIFDATITAIDSTSTTVSGAPTFRVTLQFDQSDSRIRSGMTAQVTIVTAERRGVVAIPTWLLQQDRSGSFVWIYERNQSTNREEIRKQKIALGLRSSDGYIEIIDGLIDGQKIVDQFK